MKDSAPSITDVYSWRQHPQLGAKIAADLSARTILVCNACTLMHLG